MAAGLVTIPVLDANGVSRTIQTWSSTGNVSGVLSFLQTVAGKDETNPATLTNGFPVVAIGPTADGTAATNPPVLIAGTVDGTGTGAVSVIKISATGQADVNVAEFGGTATVSGGVAGSQGVGGLAASGAAVAGNPVLHGGRAQNAEATAVANGQAVDAAYDLTGKAITLPYANKENMVRGTASATGTGATTIIAAQAAGVKTYITGLQLSNTSATTITVTMSDSASSVFIIPAGGGSNIVFPVPLVTAAATAFTFTASGSASTIFVSAQGYAGT